MRRLLALLLLVLAAAIVPTASARPAPAAAPPNWAATWKPINTEIVAMGRAINAAVQAANGKTDAQLAVQFDRLAARAGRAAGRVASYSRLPASLRAQKTKLGNGLLAAQIDLKKVANAGRSHSAPAASAAVKHLFQVVSPKIASARRVIATAAGL